MDRRPVYEDATSTNESSTLDVITFLECIIQLNNVPYNVHALNG
jgi:hypothetical protein